jgi:dipeptidyl-peptidase-4
MTVTSATPIPAAWIWSLYNKPMIQTEWKRTILVLSALSIGCGAPQRVTVTPPPVKQKPQRKIDTGKRFLVQYGKTYRFRLGRPSQVRVTPDGRSVLFLRSGPRSFVRNLYEFDVATAKERVLLTAQQVLKGSSEKLSVEEKARRERLRLAARGITSYQLSKDGNTLLIPLSGRLFLVTRDAKTVRELTSKSGYPIDPQLSPNGKMLACVRDGDLYVMNIASGKERRLTKRSRPTLSNGSAEFIAQEEMGRMHGYWWSPDSRFIAYQETDEKPVETLRIMDPRRPDKKPTAFRYPRAGTANAIVRLGVMNLASGKTKWISWDRSRFPYLATVRWQDKAPLTAVIQNRAQTKTVVLAVNHRRGSTKVLFTETDKAWVNLHDRLPKWVSGKSFLWITERNQFTQLLLVNRDGSSRALTHKGFGLRSVVSVDKEHGQVWVVAGRNPLEDHLYTVPLVPSKTRYRRITKAPGLHRATLGDNHTTYVHYHYPQNGASYAAVRHRSGAVAGRLKSLAEAPPFEPKVEWVTARGKASGKEHHALIIRPHDFDPAKKYPVILYAYGGPHYQIVRRHSHSYLLQQWLANQGYIVVSVDGRGTTGRGRAWERAIKGDFITAPLTDQTEVLLEIGKRFKQMDMSRVGVYGWSFGGYFSAMAVLKRPEVYKSAVAIAPVTDWHDYDTHYTERYLGHPKTNPEAYRISSALPLAKNLKRPLLLVHGTADDNVYFIHSLRLSDALTRAGKPHGFLPLAGFTHMVTEPAMLSRLFERLAIHFNNTLKGAQVRP